MPSHHLNQENVKAAARCGAKDETLQSGPDQTRLQWRPVHDPGAKHSALLREIRREVKRALG